MRKINFETPHSSSRIRFSCGRMKTYRVHLYCFCRETIDCTRRRRHRRHIHTWAMCDEAVRAYFRRTFSTNIRKMFYVKNHSPRHHRQTHKHKHLPTFGLAFARTYIVYSHMNRLAHGSALNSYTQSHRQLVAMPAIAAYEEQCSRQGYASTHILAQIDAMRWATRSQSNTQTHSHTDGFSKTKKRNYSAREPFLFDVRQARQASAAVYIVR